MSTVIDGIKAGSVATVAMSGLMWGSQQLGLMGEQPPERIARHTQGLLGRGADKRETQAEALALHVAFGAGSGAVYAAVRRRLPRRIPALVSGVAFGLLVWAVSYKGWVPALRIMPPPKHDRTGRPTSMIAAHLVYGAVLGMLIDRRQEQRT